MTKIPPDISCPFPLETGDHLSRDEFERRYDAMPELKKAELINGVVFMPSPVRWDRHGTQHARILGWLIQYEAATPGTQTADNGSVRLATDSEPQPDAALIILPTYGGQAKFTPDGYLEGAPELVAEIASSSVSIDRNSKLKMYQNSGVREYIIWRVLDNEIDWFVLRDGVFVALTLDADGRYRSEVFPGLWLDPAALINGNLAEVMAVLQQGIASAEHATFVAHLASQVTP